MFRTLWLRVIISIIVSVTSLILVIPNFNPKFNWLTNNKINLGLDLQGGSHLLLKVDFDNYLIDQLYMLINVIGKKLHDNKIPHQDLKLENKIVTLSLLDKESFSKVKKIINRIDNNLNLKHQESKVTIEYNTDYLENLHSRIVEQSMEIVHLRVDNIGTKEPNIQKQGDNCILLQVPGNNNTQQLKTILGKTAKLSFHLVNDNIDIPLENSLSNDKKLLQESIDGHTSYISVNKNPVLIGDYLKDAKALFREGQAVVAFNFNEIGSKIFADITRKNQGRRLAIILDNKLISAPTINEPISGGSGIISGNFTFDSANELALLLRAGALPAPLTVLEERTIGPNLGIDSIEAGKRAGIIGFIAVASFMMWCYGVFGFIANIALTLALLYILAILSLFNVTLTLPGIAGIILTMGMTVDANILIYEHIKEELKQGISILFSIKKGFKAAFATIFDSNLTTLIAAILLYLFSTGTIKGFALSLSIGIISSMFACVWITKLLIDIYTLIFKPNTTILKS